MTGKNRELLEPLNTAIRLEVEGKHLFSEALGKVTGRHAKQTFEFLLAEEDKHIARIREFHKSIEQSDKIEPISLDSTEAQRNLDFFNNKLAEFRHEIEPTVSDIEAYRFALKFENNSSDFYAEKMHEADNPHVKAFYRWLIGEEETHARLLESCLKFAEDPAAWFKERAGAARDES